MFDEVKGVGAIISLMGRILIILSIIAGVIIFFKIASAGMAGMGLLWGIVEIIGGFIFSVLLIAFGQLVDDINDIKNQVNAIDVPKQQN